MQSRTAYKHICRAAPTLDIILWGLMILCLWMKRWQIETTTALPLDREIAASAVTSI